ncbi:MAG TPA: MarC family protein [Streptosporangiaceae bacterium]|jgi:multiple antibiotic resistance protein|nr:MarC family protein [Streptosporangiaceae bacterium]
MPNHEPLVLFLALFALYSPVAALASYLPLLHSFSHAQVFRLAVGLTVNVAVFVLVAIWAGEPLLELLGITTAALTATGGIALAWEAIPLMHGHHGETAAGKEEEAAVLAGNAPPELQLAGTAPAPLAGSPPAGPLAGSAQPAAPPATSPPSPQSVLFTPLTFPLTVGGTTFAFGVAASASAPGINEKVLISIAAIAYAVVTGITLYLAGHVQRRVSARTAMLMDRLAGILLTAIAVILLVNGFTELVLARLHH